MSRYHFNVNDELDVEGFDLPDVYTAQREALAMSGMMIAEQSAATFWKAGGWKMTVTDANGLTMFELLLVGTEAAAMRNATRRVA